MLRTECERYVEWCKKYFYNPNDRKSLKAYYRLVKGERP